jgi:hypothetical protein
MSYWAFIGDVIALRDSSFSVVYQTRDGKVGYGKER